MRYTFLNRLSKFIIIQAKTLHVLGNFDMGNVNDIIQIDI